MLYKFEKTNNKEENRQKTKKKNQRKKETLKTQKKNPHPLANGPGPK
jgi:hypothetical protein